MAKDAAEVVDRRGRATSLGAYVFDLITDSGLSVSEVSRRTGISRSFLYLLRDDEQVPALDTLVALFEGIGVDEVRVAAPDEPGELAVVAGGKERWVRLPRTNKRAERTRSAWASLAANEVYAADPWDDAVAVTGPAAASTREASSGRGRRAAVSYRRNSEFGDAGSADPRQQRLSELMAAAAGLDAEKLALLIEHARLMGRD